MTILVTGGAGFIGSNFIIDWFNNCNEKVINVDALTYAGNLKNLVTISKNNNYHFVKGDIGDRSLLNKLLFEYKPRAIINFAAESHVDRSIEEPTKFVQTNIIGTFNLLESTRQFCETLDKKNKHYFRFFHVSTDEVYGSLRNDEPSFTENNQFKPNSPYSASKASSDHFVRAYNKTYGVPVLITNCSNNYGPYQFPEKLIPLIIKNALELKSLPIYGDGLQIRDWLYVGDHCNALRKVLECGKIGEVYNIGGSSEKKNLDVVFTICDILDRLKPLSKNCKLNSYRDLIKFIKDRPGHDRRYSIDTTKIRKELGWKPLENFESGIQKTIKWYLNNNSWVEKIIS